MAFASRFLCLFEEKGEVYVCVYLDVGYGGGRWRGRSVGVQGVAGRLSR